MGHHRTYRRQTATRASLAVLGATLLFLALAATTLAAPPTHPRKKALDIAGLNHACGTAVDSKGDVYASSAGESKVKVYDAAHTLLTSISNANEPCGLAVTTTGNLYVSEQATGNVVRYKPNAYPLVGSPTYGAAEPIDTSGTAKGIAVDRTDDRLYVARGNAIYLYNASGSLIGPNNEVQRVLPYGASGGTFTLSFEGQTTTALAWNATHAEVDAALEALSTIGAGNVSVAEGAAEWKGRDHLVSFEGALGSTDVQALKADTTNLVGLGFALEEQTKGYSGQIGKGSFTDATGVAAYTYGFSSSKTLNLFVADAATDQVKVFSGPEFKILKLRKTIGGVDQDRNPETPDQSFGFGPAGAYLAADPGNEDPGTKGCAAIAEQACTAGHFFLYDDANDAVDEFDATGEFLTQVKNAAFADAEPTGLAIERSGTANDGTLYVTAGIGGGAKLVAFGPLVKPDRALVPALSHVLAKAAAVATDSHGNVYVSAKKVIRVYSPQGTELTSFEDPNTAYELAVDSAGRVYVLDGRVFEAKGEQNFTYYTPSAYPPVSGTTYARHEPAIFSKTSDMTGLAVDPSNDRVFLLSSLPGEIKSVISEISPAPASTKIRECGAGLALGNARVDIGIYGATGDLYVMTNSSPAMVVDCGPAEGVEEEFVTRFSGVGCPGAQFSGSPAIAVDQSNGHVIEFVPGQVGNSAREYESSGACVAQFGTFSGGGTNPYQVAIDNACALHDPPLTEATTPTCAQFDPANGTVYVAFDGSQTNDVTALGPLNYGTPPLEPKEFKLTASKSGTGTGKVTSSPSGIDCGLDCEEVYAEATKVTLTASPEGGSTFKGWSGACTGTGTCEVTMSAAKAVTAEFTAAAKPKFLLKVKKAGSGTGTVTSSPAGINCGLDCEEEYDEGTLVTLTGAAGANTKPVTWTGCNSVNGENKCLVTMSSAKEVTATFALEQHLLSVSKAGSGTGKVTSSPAGIDCGSDCSELYDHGTPVTLSATPEGGSTFTGWSGSGCSGTGTCEVTMSAAKAVTAEFTAAAKPKFKLKVKAQGSGTGTVTSSPSGINCGLDCEEEYDEGTLVTLTGAAGANTKPVVWSNCDSVNGENKCLVTMSGAKEVTATFALEQHLLSVSKTGSGTGKVTSSPPGIDCGSTCSASFDHGTVVTLSASPDAGSEFSGWSGACSGTGTCEVTMSAAKAVTATFEEEEAPPGGIALTVDVEGTGSGTVTSDKGTISCDPFCSDEYPEGTVVTLTASPAPGSVFMSWRYCDKGGVNGRQCTITLDKAKTVKATFTTTHALEVSKAPGSGMGKVQSSPGGILCLFNCSETTASFKEGTNVIVKQTPAKHFHFVQWLGDCTGSGACELTMGQDHEVQALFAEDARHLLTLTKSGGGTGTVKSSIAGISCGVTCSQIASAYYQGEVVELTATPSKGSSLGGWTGCDSEPEGRCLVAISEAKGVTAEFK